MMTLTVRQPYADLIARGVKLVENRSWPTSHRGPLLIHAAKSKAELSEDEIDYIDGLDLKWDIPRIPYGAIVAVVNVVDCVALEDLDPEQAADPFAFGPFCWILADARRLKPIPWKGKLGLWEFTGTIPTARRKQTK